MLSKVYKLIQEMGALEESDTDRDGFLSYSAETHAVAVGLGVGFLATASGQASLVGVIIPTISAGLRGKSADGKSKILTDVKTEPHYALGGLAAGAAAGYLLRAW